ncbi:MAG: NAD(P)-dependent glycerol-1-phosphate dehydrogenase [Fimbriimonadales bacterium]|nr:MAG: NAD(P)-dependent glycerol-1-phosphate dehydrogenase [Fimbriimonadales bacterium]
MPFHPFSVTRFASVSELNPLLDDALMVVDPQAWFAARQKLDANPRSLVRAESLDEIVLQTIEHATEAWAEVGRVVGLGGGTAIDTAKYLAWRKELPLILVPSALTVDAPFTDSAAVRRGGRIHYTGRIYPEAIYVDAELIRTAPPHLNRGGVGDLLSIHTALYDWQLSHERTGEPYDPLIAQQSAAILERLRQHAPDVYAVNEIGVRLMTELFCEEVYLCYQADSSRPEEGSEHHLLYTLEHQTGRTYLHGAAVTLCALLVAYLQGNRPDALRALADACGVEYRALLHEAGEPAILKALLTAREYALEERLPYTFLMETPIDFERAQAALEWLKQG